ncbi:glycoside hydrolase family protein [Frateuria sp. Soil773]|uniref:glycoside hydrolase family protein n=1 Tax=Frateuria sp. Soil773 TaxID=1736407 RepID=UPI00138EE4E9|nr:glycoside hydrolase family protein [Frateuria sp. Soil773]
MPVTDRMVQQSLSSGIAAAERQVRSSVRDRQLTQEQFDAAVSFVYNTGRTDALQPANAGRMAEVAQQMHQYVYACQYDRRGRRIP